jgi:hypothetical protein
VRRAANLAIDRATINEALTLGFSKLTNNLIPASFEFYWQPPPPVYDPAKAKRLLAEAGILTVRRRRLLLRLIALECRRGRLEQPPAGRDPIAAATNGDREFANCRILRLLQLEGEKMMADVADICRGFTAKLQVRVHLSSRSHQSLANRIDQKCALRMAQRSICRDQQTAAVCGPAPRVGI